MSEVTTYALRCPRCGGSLAVAKSLETFTCEYCGSSVQVQRQGGAVSLALLGDAIQMVQRGTDKTAAELAIRRISEESAVRDRQRAKLVEERKAQEGFWRVKIYAKKNDGNFWLLAIIAGVTFWIAYVTGEGVSDGLRITGAAMCTGVVCFFVFRGLRNGRTAAVSKLTAEMDSELAQRDAAVSAIEQEITVDKQKLAKQREIVDS